MSKCLNLDGLTYFWGKVKSYITTQLGTKVDKVDGKGLSTNDLTDALKTNYDAAYAHLSAAHAPASAAANVIESIKRNGTALAITNKTVNITVPTTVAEMTDAGNYALKSEMPDVPSIEAITNAEIDAIFAA